MRKVDSPLNRKLVFAILLVSSLASILVSGAQILYAWTARKQEVFESVTNDIEASLASLQRSVWYLDEKQAVANLRVIAADPYVARVEVTVKGKPGFFAESGKALDDYDFVRTWPIKSILDNGQYEIGQIRVLGRNDTIRIFLVKQALFILGTNLLKGVFLSFGLLVLFDRVVTRHILDVSRHLKLFDPERLVRIPLRTVRKTDEIDSLIDAVNLMQVTIEQAQKEEHKAKVLMEEEQAHTLEISHKIAMAEVTTALMHDINNILGSLTAVTLRAKRDLKLKPAEDVVTSMIEGVEKTTGIIVGIIQSQQQLALGRDDQWDKLALKEIIHDAISVENYNLEKLKIKVSVAGDMDRVITTRRNILVTILVNVIKNARESIQSVMPEARKITISVETGRDNFHLKVRDSGAGASLDTLSKIFERGFTTKDDGHGFGLFGCRYNMKNLGGDLSIASEGLGMGAIVTLVHPYDAALTAPKTV